jgi:hypothetical protein
MNLHKRLGARLVLLALAGGDQVALGQRNTPCVPHPAEIEERTNGGVNMKLAR